LPSREHDGVVRASGGQLADETTELGVPDADSPVGMGGAQTRLSVSGGPRAQ
jgi:hypothetical protein